MSNAIENLLLGCAVFRAHIGAPSGRKKINWQRIGIPNDLVNPDIVTSGQMFTIPKKEIARIQKLRGKAITVIEKYGLPFSVGRLIPNSKIQDVRQELGAIKMEFNAAVDSLRQRYPELKQELLNLWQQEAIVIAERHDSNDEDFIFEVMAKVENEFPEWSYFERKFYFEWKEYSDFSDMAEEFIRDSTRSVLEKMAEFAQSLKEKLELENVSERNMLPIRRWLESVRDAVSAFHNERLNSMVEEMEIWTEEGVASEVRDRGDMARGMMESLNDVITYSTEYVDDVVSESVAALTTQRRTVERKSA